jgi:hypothetical protein
MLDSSGSDFQDSSSPGSFEFAQSQRNKARRASSTTTPSAEFILPLPPPKELAPRSPYHHAIEPPMPQPKRSRRYQKDSVRMPDICVGKISPIRTIPQDKLQVQCDSCQRDYVVPKSCVLLKCPNCKHISSAMPAVAKGFSMRTNDYSFASR